MKLIFLSMILSSGIFVSTGRFNYMNYDRLAHVVEGELILKQIDSLTVRVTRVWSGSSTAEEEITFINSYSFNYLEQGNTGLFMVDSAGFLQSYGLPGDGFYILNRLSSPNILTYDDLYLLSHGEEPEFNNHESRITVHFPLSSEELEIKVVPTDSGRRTRSSIDVLDDAVPTGNMCYESDHSTVFSMNLTDLDIHPRFQRCSFSGNVESFSNGIYYIDLWPENPCFASIESMIEYFEYSAVPVYCFRIEIDNADHWTIGLPEVPFMVSSGEKFYLRGRQLFVGSNPEWQSGVLDLCFPAFSSGGHSARRTLLRIHDINPELGCPYLADMLESLQYGALNGTLYYLESNDSEPIEYSECTIDLYSPSFQIETNTNSGYTEDISGSVLSFTETGQAILEFNGSSYSQILDDLDLPHPYQSSYFTTYVVFENPFHANSYLLLHFTNVGGAGHSVDAHNILLSRIIHIWLRDGCVEGNLIQYDIGDREIEELDSFTMYSQ